MRWVLAALILVNVGLYMWGSWYKDSDVPQPATPQPAVNEDNMRLLSEPGVKPVPRRRGKSPAAQTLTAVKRICHTVGPFPASQSATRAGGRLRKKNLSYTLRSKRTEAKTYRVYIPSLPSHKAVLAMQKKLSRLGFQDNAVIHERRMKNTISVGVFEVKANADKRRRKLRKQGIKARRQTLRRIRSRYWLDVRSEEASVETLGRMRWGVSGVSVKETACANPVARKRKSRKSGK